MAKQVRIGAMDWRDPAWTGSFYPGDMPEEWRLSFYASQYNCVFLQAARWRRASPLELGQWREDVHGQFVFLLEGEDQANPPEALVQKARIISRADPSIHWFDRNSDLKQLAACIESAPEDTELFLVSRDGDLGQMERVVTLLELMGY
jgi:hypothetical protein